MWLRSLSAPIAVTLLLAGCGSGSAPHTSSGQGSGGAGGAGGPTGAAVTGGAAPANGIAGEPANQIVAAASRAIDRARSVHVAGLVVDNGIRVRLDLQLARGEGGQGEVSENGLGFRLISTGKVLFIQGSDAFWTHFGGAGAVKLFHGKWLKAPDAGQFGTLGRLATTQGLVGQLLSRHGRLSRGRLTTVDGQPALGLVDRMQGSTLYVATQGPAYPLEIVKRGANGGYVKFTDFDQPVTITPPAHSIALPAGG